MPWTRPRLRYPSLCAGQEAVEHCCGRSLLQSAWVPLGHMRQPGAALGRQHSPVRKRALWQEEKQRLRRLSAEHRGKVGQAMALRASSSARHFTPQGGDSMSFFLSPKGSRARLREAENARKNRAEIIQAVSQGQVTRRDLVKWGLITAAGLWLPKNGLSPFTRSAYAGDSIP